MAVYKDSPPFYCHVCEGKLAPTARVKIKVPTPFGGTRYDSVSICWDCVRKVRDFFIFEYESCPKQPST